MPGAQVSDPNFVPDPIVAIVPVIPSPPSVVVPVVAPVVDAPVVPADKQ
jgi:hypothetical protein